MKRLLSICFMALSFCLLADMPVTGSEPFWLGADVAGATMMERMGNKLFNAKGEEQEEISMLHDMGLNAIRLRIWVNPKDGWCTKEDQLTLALRARRLGMPVMVSFHYSDTWADPGNQTIPEGWKNFGYEEMKHAVAHHTAEVLRFFKLNGIDVRWVNIGNETRHGMLWPMGNSEDNMEQYAGLTQAGCQAAKTVYPEVRTMVHIDGGVDPIRYNKILNAFKQYNVDYDMVGLSCYPYWDQEQGLEAEDSHTITDCVANINGLFKKFGKESIVVETGYNADYPEEGYKFLTDLIHALRTETDGHCHGIFYWAPEIDQNYLLGAFRNQRPTKIMDAFTEAASQSAKPAEEVKELWIENGIRKIYGIESIPLTGNKKKVAIVSHGFNGTSEFARDYFATLNSLGYIVYAMDYPGGSIHSRSDANTLNMSIIDEKEDLKAIVRYFQQQQDIDTENIILIGESQGGLVSALAAAEMKDEISKLILIYPALCIPDNWNERYKTAKEIPAVTEFWGVKLSRRFFEEIREIKVYPTITKYTNPVLIVHGSKDPVVPLSYSEQAMKEYKDAHIGVIPGAGHGFRPAERNVSNAYVAEFLAEQ